MRLFRIVSILYIVARKRLDRLLPTEAGLPLWARMFVFCLRIIPAPRDPAPVSLRLTFEELGPVFIKFGQILSSRRDLFSDEIAIELQRLQDRVPPFASDAARQIVEDALAGRIDELFASFEDTPLASASVAQVHGATLNTGEAVVVKIIRPDMKRLIVRDIQVMYLLADMLERGWKEGRRLHPVDIVKDYERTILDELDLQLEAANATQLRHNWQHTGKLYVPLVYWDYTRTNVMVMERVYGISAANLEEIKARQVNMRKLAHLGVEIFFTQVFEDNFFHADMHPGNVHIDATDPENPNYIALDCAIIGSLTEEDKNYLAKNILAFFHRDYYEVARLHVESGWVAPDTDIKEFESVIRSVCEPVFQKPIKDISFGRVVVGLFQTARRFDMEVQPQLVLLQKTLLNIEGMGRQIYPDLDLWETAAPFMEKWMAERMGLAGVMRRIKTNAPGWLQHLPDLPDLAFDALTELKQLGRTTREQTLTLQALQTELARQNTRNRYYRLGGVALVLAMVGTLMTVSGVVSPPELLVGSSLLGGLGIYWMFIKP
ncbi:MAG: ubiquinone biosynthesis regulatory protein kinase UbiB [Pseudomonadales bacterium]